jgi:hypothetical protein
MSDPVSIVNSVLSAGTERVVLVVACNLAHRPFLLNFVESLRKLRLDNKLLLVAMDQAMEDEAEKMGLPTLAGTELLTIPNYSGQEQQQEMVFLTAAW